MANREPSAVDQLMLELINRARANPQQEADRLLNGELNEGVPQDSLISSSAKQPLTFNYQLIESAYNHSQWMLDNDILSHTGVDNTTSQQRMAIAGFPFVAPWGSGENIAWKGTTGIVNVTQFVIENYKNLFIDENYPNRGHRVTLMDDDFQEVGIASLEGIFTEKNRDYNAVMTTQDFAYTQRNGAFITGVVYSDQVINDNFYSVGEGIGNVRIVAQNLGTGDRLETRTFASGGYSLLVPSGNYEVSFSGNFDQDPEEETIKRRVSINEKNVKVDLATDNPNNDNKLDSLMNTPIYRLQNLAQPGTYLYADEVELNNIQRNYPQFRLEGFAFNVSKTDNDELMPIYRFRNQKIAGTYLFVGEEEKNNIVKNYPNFVLEGVAFHVLPGESDMGNALYRFQNANVLGTYLFAGEAEKNNIVRNYPNFILEGTAFNVN